VKDELSKALLEKQTMTAMKTQLNKLMDEAQIDNFLENTSQSGKMQTAKAPAAPGATKTR